MPSYSAYTLQTKFQQEVRTAMYPTKVWFAHTILPQIYKNTQRAIYEQRLEDLCSIRRTVFYIITHRNLRKILVLGAYFHRRTALTITVEKGGGTLLTQPVNNAGKPAGDKVTQMLRAGDPSINIEPLTAYTFKLWPNTYVGGERTQLWPSDEDETCTPI